MQTKILIADNDSGVCNSFAFLLRSEGYCVDATTDSTEAAILIKKDRYDVCFFDYKMDGFNGIDLLEITKTINPQCAVFIFSGMLNIEELCNKEIDDGLVTGIVTKPFRIEALLQKITALADGRIC